MTIFAKATIARTAVGCIALLTANVAQTKDFNWRDPADQRKTITAFQNLSRGCSDEFGFTRVPSLTAEELRGRLQAYWLLSSSPEASMRRWLAMINGWLALKGPTDELAERGADALIAAHSDPTSYARAEALWVSTVMGPINKALNACQAAANDEFIGQYFVTGVGSAAKYEQQARDTFAKGVAQLKRERG